MKEKGFLKKMCICLLAGLLAVSFTMPVQAAVYKKDQSKVIKAGESYHILDNQISRNKVVKYALKVTVASSGAMFDLAYASNGKEGALKNCTKNVTVENPKTFYIKSYSGSNTGMLACLKVHKGSVRVRVDYKAQYKNASFTFKKQAASHKTLLGVSVPKGRQVSFRQRGSNITTVPVVISSRQGSFTRRILNSANATFENYTFMPGYMKYRYYADGKLVSSKNKNVKYDTSSGAQKYIQVLMPNRYSGWFATKKGTVTYYFPSDYLNIAVSRK